MLLLHYIAYWAFASRNPSFGEASSAGPDNAD